MYFSEGNCEKNTLAIDAGNTNVVFAIYQNNQLIHSFSVETKKHNCYDYYAEIIAEISKYPIQIICSAISSVVPEITEQIMHLIEDKFSIKCHYLDHNSSLGLTFDMPDSSHLGSDLVVNAYAAHQKYTENCIICDLGTATTIQLVSSEGVFHGAAILPGIKLSNECLWQKASKLKPIDLEKPESILGKTTKDALLSGILNGHKFVLAGFIAKIKNEYKNLGNFKTIATGGLAKLVCEEMSSIDLTDSHLLLDGLNLFCMENRTDG